MMGHLNSFNYVDSYVIKKAAEQYGTPLYLYDERTIADRCGALRSAPNAYGLTVRFAMKANSTRALLKTIYGEGISMDASSMNEVRRARAAGINYGDIILTTQEAPLDDEMRALEDMISQGLKYNVCSLHQLYNIGDFAAENKVSLAMRVHPGVGSGASAARNTGDKYSCFGVHLTDLEQALGYADGKGIIFDHVHVHIGSGADPDVWQSNIDLELGVVEKYFPHARTVNFGGGLREARMPEEEPADIQKLCGYAQEKIERFYLRTNRKLTMEIEPGNFLMANAGFIITKVVDKKKTGGEGLNFLVLDGGMDLNARPIFYAAEHPFYVVSGDGRLLSSEFGQKGDGDFQAVLVGVCCESGDSQCLNEGRVNTPRCIGAPGIGDYVAIGGAGAYCATMSPLNYNSHLQAAEVLYTRDGELKKIRSRQSLEQLMANEI